MRKHLLIVATAIAAMFVAVLVPTSAHADGSTVINLGPGQYNVGFTHPTGTVTIGGGTISARCTAAAAKGSSVLLTPQCTTKPIRCPVSSAGCAVVFALQESALRGPVAVSGNVLVTGGSGAFDAVLQPYSCPQPNTCGTRVRDLFTPGTTIQLTTFNIAVGPNFPIVFSQATLTVL